MQNEKLKMKMWEPCFAFSSRFLILNF
jgi:hypothetical protein